jgi:hypothetical protein
MPGHESSYDGVLSDLMKVAARIRTKPMSEEWKRSIGPSVEEALSDPARRALRDKLLSLGGEEALVRPSDVTPEEIERLMSRGKLWPGSRAHADFYKMEAINCHGNSACLMKEGFGEVVNGYALSEDGMWRPHSWVLQKDGRLIETTKRRKAYFGAVLTRREVLVEYGAF